MEPAGQAPEPELLDFDNWKRKEHFEFFLGYTEPFFSLVAEVDCTALVRSRGPTTFQLWHGVLRTANELPDFRLRILDGRPVRYPAIHLSPTVLRPDETFTITFVPYSEQFQEFHQSAREAVARATESTGLNLDPEARRIDLIHFSTIPWFRFSALSHARHLGRTESEMKVTLGRFYEVDGRYRIPVSITAHHSLVDGLHVGRYLQRLEELYASW